MLAGVKVNIAAATAEIRDFGPGAEKTDQACHSYYSRPPTCIAVLLPTVLHYKMRGTAVLQKTREGAVAVCGGLFGGARGKLQESPGKTAGIFSRIARNAINSRISAQGRETLGRHCLDLIPPSVRGVFREWPQHCRKECWTKMVQSGPNDHFGQNDLIPNWILAFGRPKWTKTVHFAPFWLEEVHFGPFRSAKFFWNRQFPVYLISTYVPVHISYLFVSQLCQVGTSPWWAGCCLLEVPPYGADSMHGTPINALFFSSQHHGVRALSWSDRSRVAPVLKLTVPACFSFSEYFLGARCCGWAHRKVHQHKVPSVFYIT